MSTEPTTGYITTGTLQGAPLNPLVYIGLRGGSATVYAELATVYALKQRFSATVYALEK